MEHYNNIFCISKPDLTDGDPRAVNVKDRPVMTESALHIYLHRHPHVRVRSGKGTGRHALLNYEALPTTIKQKLFDKYGDIRQYQRRNRLVELIEPDYAAAKFFREYEFDDGSNIGEQRQAEYAVNATLLNAIGRFVSEKIGFRRSKGGSTVGIWQAASDSVNALDKTRYNHTLPSNWLRLKDKYKHYQDHGYLHLIHKGTGNRNAAKRNEMVDNLIISLYCRKNIPFGEWVYDDYHKFLSGSEVIFDRDSGEIFDREEFFDHKRGTYMAVSRSTVWNIVNDPQYKSIIDRLRNNRIDHITQMCPYDHRKGPQYSLSMLTMDDRTFSRKTTDGKWLNAYVGADVMSEAILGIVFTLDKPGKDTVWQCFRKIYQTLSDNHLMWPGELECENHLMRDIEDDLKAMFQYVSFGTPGIGRGKFIENIFRRKKYGDEKRHQVGIGRHNQKGAFKIKVEKKDPDYQQVRLPVETLMAEELASIERWNNDLHPNQKKFPGKSRWDVLKENINPDLGRPQKHRLFKHMGILAKDLTIWNQDWVQVQYEKYCIDHIESLDRLKPNNYKVNAYYLPGPDGSIGEVYLYQDDTFITRATKVERYQKSKIEATEDDERIRTERAKRTSHFFKVEKDRMAEHVTRNIDTMKPDTYEDILVEIVPEPVQNEEEYDMDELIQKFSGYDELAIEKI